MPYKEYKPEKLYYSIGEVAAILGESTSLVRFWSDTFSDFVRPERNRKGNRRFTPGRCGNSQGYPSSGQGFENDAGRGGSPYEKQQGRAGSPYRGD